MTDLHAKIGAALDREQALAEATTTSQWYALPHRGSGRTIAPDLWSLDPEVCIADRGSVGRAGTQDEEDSVMRDLTPGERADLRCRKQNLEAARGSRSHEAHRRMLCEYSARLADEVPLAQITAAVDVSA